MTEESSGLVILKCFPITNSTCKPKSYRIATINKACLKESGYLYKLNVVTTHKQGEPGLQGFLTIGNSWYYLCPILLGQGSEKRDSSTRAGAHSSKELPLTTPIQFSMPLLWAGKVGDPNPSQGGAHRISLPVKPQALVGIDGQNCHLHVHYPK